MSKSIFLQGDEDNSQFPDNPLMNDQDKTAQNRKSTSNFSKSKRGSKKVEKAFKKKISQDLSLIDLNIDSDESSLSEDKIKKELS